MIKPPCCAPASIFPKDVAHQKNDKTKNKKTKKQKNSEG